MPQVVSTIATRLNLTLEFVPNFQPGEWGVELPDGGGWTGMINMTMEEEVDVAAAGFSRNVQRDGVVDFSVTVVGIETQLYTRRNSRNRLSLINYLYEFDRRSWILILLTVVCLMLAFCSFAKMLNWRRRDGPGDRSSPVIVLRNLLYQGGSFKSGRMSLRLLLLVNLMFASVVVLSYRSCMNAFLTVTVPVIDVKNLDEVEDKGKRLTFWRGSATEAMLANAAPESAEWRLYQTFRQDDRGQTSSYEEGIQNVLDHHEYALLAEEVLLPPYPCEVVQVPKYVFGSFQLCLVFPRGSLLLGPFNREILRMKQEGVIDRLVSFHLGTRAAEQQDCGALSRGVTSLTFDHVFAPFGLLALGLLAALALGAGERLLCHRRSSPTEDRSLPP